jgi:HK97 family phage major capsid protein
MAFGRRELHPHPLAKRIKISNTALRTATIDVEALVLDRLAYKRGISQEKAFLTGDGNKQPLGIFTASNDGIPTGAMSSVARCHGITFDGLTDVKYSMKSQYWAKGALALPSRRAQAALEDQGRRRPVHVAAEPPGRPAGHPARLPFDMSEYAPNTFTTGQYVGMIGDYSFYWIADSLDLQIQRLIELYAEANQTGYITRQETDGMPVLDEAFSRIKLA